MQVQQRISNALHVNLEYGDISLCCNSENRFLDDLIRTHTHMLGLIVMERGIECLDNGIDLLKSVPNGPIYTQYRTIST